MAKQKINTYSDSDINIHSTHKLPDLNIDWEKQVKNIFAKNTKTDECRIFKTIININEYRRQIKRGIEPDYFQEGLSYYTLPEVKEIFKDQSEWIGHVEYRPEKIWTAEDYKIVADYYYEKYHEALKEIEKLKTTNKKRD